MPPFPQKNIGEGDVCRQTKQFVIPCTVVLVEELYDISQDP